MNKLVVIGWMGIKTAYLNVPRADPIARYMKDNGDDTPLPDSVIKEFEFDDEFSVYDADSKSP